MRARLYFLLFFSLLTISAKAQFESVKEGLTQKPLQDQYVSYLNTKGYNPEIDQDGDIKFTYNNKRYYITLDVKDPEFFRVARLANLKLTTPANITRAKEICHDLTKDLKVTKVYWLNGQIWCSSEQYLADPEDYQDLFDRTLKLTESAYNQFVKAWQEKDL